MEDIDRFLEKKISILELNSPRESQKANSFLAFVFNSKNKNVFLSKEKKYVSMGIEIISR